MQSVHKLLRHFRISSTILRERRRKIDERDVRIVHYVVRPFSVYTAHTNIEWSDSIALTISL